jgi:hypothetical protein
VASASPLLIDDDKSAAAPPLSGSYILTTHTTPHPTPHHTTPHHTTQPRTTPHYATQIANVRSAKGELREALASMRQRKERLEADAHTLADDLAKVRRRGGMESSSPRHRSSSPRMDHPGPARHDRSTSVASLRSLGGGGYGGAGSPLPSVHAPAAGAYRLPVPGGRPGCGCEPSRCQRRCGKCKVQFTCMNPSHPPPPRPSAPPLRPAPPPHPAHPAHPRHQACCQRQTGRPPCVAAPHPQVCAQWRARPDWPPPRRPLARPAPHPPAPHPPAPHPPAPHPPACPGCCTTPAPAPRRRGRRGATPLRPSCCMATARRVRWTPGSWGPSPPRR